MDVLFTLVFWIIVVALIVRVVALAVRFAPFAVDLGVLLVGAVVVVVAIAALWPLRGYLIDRLAGKEETTTVNTPPATPTPGGVVVQATPGATRPPASGTQPPSGGAQVVGTPSAPALTDDGFSIPVSASSVVAVRGGVTCSGDLRIKGGPVHDDNGFSAMVTYFQRDAEVVAEWGASCMPGDQLEAECDRKKSMRDSNGRPKFTSCQVFTVR